MTSTQPMEATVLREQRTDRAERTLALSMAPILEYTKPGTWRKPEPTQVRWQPLTMRMSWDMGRLWSVHLAGVRLKKDGNAGSTRDSAHWTRLDGKLLPTADSASGPPPEWLIALVEKHAEAPPFKPMAQVGA